MKSKLKRLEKVMLLLYQLYLRLLFLFAPKRAAVEAFRLFSTPQSRKLRHRESEVLAKAAKKRLQFEGNGIQSYYWGEAPAKKVALLVHGWEGNAGSLGAFVAPLNSLGYQVFSFDGPAHGASEGRQTDLFHFARLILRFLQEHQVEVLLTHSFGSAAAVVALAQLDRFPLQKLVMLTSPDQLEDVVGSFTAYLKINPKGKALLLRHMEVRFGKKTEDVAVSKLLPQLSIDSLLLMHSKTDRILPFQYAVQISQAFPKAILELPVDLGHYRLLWDPGVVERVKRFLAS